MGRVGDRIRASRARRRHARFDAVRTEITTALETSVATSVAELQRDLTAERESAEARAADHELDLVNALHRIADAFESVAASLEADRRERRDQLDAVEFLLREMVLGFTQPTAIPAGVLGGSITPGSAGGSEGRVVDIDLSDSPIAVGDLVEVRSRFHDQWVHGFAVSEYISAPSRRGYRLRRITDTDQLPLLFDAADVRRSVPAPEIAVDATEEPESSMWR
jgi:hypothetical protein